MTADVEDRVARSLDEWAHGIHAGPGDVAGAIVRARRLAARRRVLVASAVAVVAVVAGVFVTRPTTSAVHTAALPPASTTPATLPDVPHWGIAGWRATYFVALPSGAGRPSYVEYQLDDGAGHRLQLSFYPASEDRGKDEPRTAVTVHTVSGSLLDYGEGRYRVDWHEGARTIEADGSSYSSPADFLATVERTGPLDDAAWAASLPTGTVLPGDARTTAIDALLEGVPLPTGFDRTTLNAGPAATPYNLAADVYGHVACTWITTWGDAQRAGDANAAQTAADALATSRNWSGLVATTADGDYASVLWSLADRVAAGDTTVLDGYHQALGC